RFLPERRGTEDPLESCGNDSEVAVVSPEDALPGGPEAVAASPRLESFRGGSIPTSVISPNFSINEISAIMRSREGRKPWRRVRSYILLLNPIITWSDSSLQGVLGQFPGW
ncbi:hypothetical protein E4U23_000171, partial [Claviceps purpurea]